VFAECLRFKIDFFVSLLVLIGRFLVLFSHYSSLCVPHLVSCIAYYSLQTQQTKLIVVLRPVAQLYGQVRTDWNQCFVIVCSFSHPAGHKPFTCSHSVLRNTWLNIHAVRWMRFSARLFVHVFTISQNLTSALLVSSAVSELSSAWSTICFLRYVCCCIVVKDKSLSVLMVDRCCCFASLKPVQNSRE